MVVYVYCNRGIMNGMSLFFFSSRRRHTRLQGDWSSDVCSSDLILSSARRDRLSLTYWRLLAVRYSCAMALSWAVAGRPFFVPFSRISFATSLSELPCSPPSLALTSRLESFMFDDWIMA